AGDIYSLGVVLYELLTGTRPFKGTATEVIGQILHVEPEKPSQRRTGIDPRLESICLKAMAKRPEERFASMKEFAAAIDAVLRTPKPVSGSAETMQPIATRRDGEEATSSENMADLFAVMSMERKATRAETAAVVEAALSKYRTPRWVFVAIGVVMLSGFIALGGIIFFTRTPTATVMINIDVDLNDKTLSFFLDGKQVSAESLQAPIELKVGTHELLVKRGEEVIRKFTFTVSRDAGPRIELREETPPKKQEPVPKKEPPQSDPKTPDDLARWQGTWRCVAEHSSGKRLTEDELKQRGTIMRIEGNRREVERTLDGRFSRYAGNFQVNPAKSPKEFDYDDEQGKGPRNFHRGIYEFEGERLRLIYRHAQGNVPQRAGWKDIGQPNVVWFEFERVPEDPDQKLAEWLLSLNPLPGPQRAVFVATGDGERRRIDDVKLLPAGKFRVTQIDTWGNKNVTDANVEPILQWLERSQVDTISFHGNAIGDATVEKLVKIKTLKSIWLGGTKITDRSLELLATRPDLRLTGFDGTKITDAGVAHLARMTDLESLGFYNTPLTDEGLKHLVGLKKLRILNLGVTKITPQGVRLLKDLPIERLNIIACHPVASELKVLKEFPRLSHLEASGLKLIDRDADLLAELQSLETLALNHNRLTDDGLQKLTALRSLKELALTDNPVTAEGVAKFQRALPKCTVHWDKK
ncbi:MAG: TIGR03067 domain-containing protein, partial [Gemmataceae bacterium]|nr:TIGR03067 domain-containing protein [Gemmataceae bacterium]